MGPVNPAGVALHQYVAIDFPTAEPSVEPFPKRNDWLKHCLCGDTGKPLPVLANALTALRNDPALRDAFAYDEMLYARRSCCMKSASLS